MTTAPPMFSGNQAKPDGLSHAELMSTTRPFPFGHRAPAPCPMGMRLDRFGPKRKVVAGQIGLGQPPQFVCLCPCAGSSPVIELHLARLRHHQPASVRVALQWRDDDGSWRTVTSSDLRTEQGSVSVVARGLSSGDVGMLALVAEHRACLVAGVAGRRSNP